MAEKMFKSKTLKFKDISRTLKNQNAVYAFSSNFIRYFSDRLLSCVTIAFIIVFY